jgi:phosphatidylglycerol---prolipoprotein diacylglyceryl transferase
MLPFAIVSAGAYNAGFSLAVLSALALAHRAGRRQGEPPLAWAVLLAFTIAGAIVGSKLLFLDFQPIAPGEKTNLGGLIGGITTMVLMARLLRLGAWRSLDAVTVPTLVGMAIGRVGCFFAGCCAGTATSLPWAVRDADGHAVHPVQLYEAAADLLLVGALTRRLPARTAGARFLSATLAYAAIRFTTEFVREGRAVHLGLNLLQWSLLGIATLVAVIEWQRSANVARGPAAPAHAVRPAPVRDTRDTRSALVALAGVVVLVAGAWGSTGWFVPLEQLALFALAGGLTAATLTHAAEGWTVGIRARALPFAILPRLGAMMMQEPATDERPRRELLVGGSVWRSAYDQAIGQAYGTNCDGGLTNSPTLAEREATLVDASVGLRTPTDSGRRTIGARLIAGRDRLGSIAVGPRGFEPESNGPWAVGASVESEQRNWSSRFEVLGGQMNRTDGVPTSDPTLTALLRVGDDKGWFTEFNYADARFTPMHREFSRVGIGYTDGRDRLRGVVGIGNGLMLRLFVPVRRYELDLTVLQVDASKSGGGSGESLAIGLRRAIVLR